MDLQTINDCFNFYFRLGAARGNANLLQELESQQREKALTLFTLLFAQRDNIKKKGYNDDDCNKVLAIALEALVTRAMKSQSPKSFDTKERLYSYINRSLFGFNGHGGLAARMRNENKSIVDDLTEKIKKNKKNPSLTNSDDTQIEGIDENNISDESFDYDEDGNEITNKVPLIETVADTSLPPLDELTDIPIVNNTVAYLLALIRIDLSADDKALEKKIAWQVGNNYQMALLNEKTGLFADPILISNDSTAIVRYEHWHKNSGS